MSKGEKLMAKGSSMKLWEKDDMKLFYNTESSIWSYSHKNRKITLITWRSTQKGAMTEITMGEGKFKLLMELLEIRYHEEWYNPGEDDWNKICNEIANFCKCLEKISLVQEPLMSPAEIECCLRRIFYAREDVKEIHVYYGLGLSMGMRKNARGKIRRLETVPNRTMRYPSSRFDSIL